MKSLTYIEIDVDRCSNVFGASPCAAALGVGNDAAEYWDFANNTLNSFTGSSITLSASTSGMTGTSSGTDPIFVSPDSLGIDGSKYYFLVIDWERITTASAFDGTIFYTTPGHSTSGSFCKHFSDIPAGHREIMVLDMSALSAGGNDFLTSTVNQLRFDFDAASGGVIKIHSIRVCVAGPSFKCFNSLKTCVDRLHLTAQTETLRFCMSSMHYPIDIDAVPSLTAISFTPATISLGEDLGQRATFQATFVDHPHTDTGPGGDRYLVDRTYDPWFTGSFWGKFRARFPYLQGRPLRVYRGVLGQTLAQMDVRYYVIDSFDGPDANGQFTVTAKDVLKLADDDKSQAPGVSVGFLSLDLTSSATSFTVGPTGAGATYPASGYINIGGSEICSYTRSGDVFTITRGQFNTTASAHSNQDRVQWCLQYSAASPADILYDLLVNYASIPATFINLPVWQTEINNFLQRSYTALIPEATGVNTLVSELIEQAALAMWWDDASQSITLRVLRAIPTNATTLNEDVLNSGSIAPKEQPDLRLSQVWTYYALINPLVDLSETSNYRSVELEIAEQLEADYGSSVVKQIFSRWIPQFGRSIATRLNELILGRYQDPPRIVTFESFGPISSYLTLGGGYNMQFRTLQDEQGMPTTVPLMITRLNPDSVTYQVEAQEALFAVISADDLNNRVIIIDTSTNDFNLKTVHDGLFPPFVDPTGITITCIIQSGVIVGNDQSLQPLGTRGVAFDVGAFPSGTNITIQLDGDIRAGGGYGGSAPGTTSSTVGQIGGTGLRTTIAIKVKDTTGRSIQGGGGGGGGKNSSGFPSGASGGGGGAGQIPGAGGPGSLANGSPGTLTAGGAGGASGFGGSIVGGVGGNPGTAGATATQVGGAAGLAIDGVSHITYTNLTPTITGPTV